MADEMQINPDLADRAAPDVTPEPMVAQQHVELLCILFAEMTHRDHVGPDESFFAIGGRGRAAIELVARIRDHVGVELPSQLLFTHPTARLLAPVLHTLPLAQYIRGQMMDLQLIRPARPRRPSRGVMLCMPQIGGGDDYATFVAASAFQDFDIWATRFDLDGNGPVDAECWIEAAIELAEWLHVNTAILRPRALLGFSMGGYLGWLVDRILVSKGHAPTRLLNLDGDAVPIYYPGTAARLRRQVRDLDDLAPANMLLLHRESFGQMTNPVQIDTDWAHLGVAATRLPCRTISHADFLSHSLLGSYDRVMTAFVCPEDSALQGVQPPAQIETPAGWLWGLLDRLPGVGAEDVRAFVRHLPGDPIHEELVLGVLWLAAASGDAAFALEITRRVIAERPNDRNAHYVLVGLLQELGRSDEAAAVVAQWLARRTDPDPVLQKRATERIYGDVGWPEARGLFVKGEPGERALDYAVARAAAPS